MSSLAAARADNFYYPPHYDPAKHGSLNKFNGQHALRERAKKIDQGILVIRFEVPFHIWCEKCGEMIGKGVRFNAEKKQVGSYYSTKIWSFSMRHHCGGIITIQTDPKNAEYNITAGARKKVEEYTAADAETVELPSADERAVLDDPIARLEHATTDKQNAKKSKVLLEDLQDLTRETAGNDFAVNRMLRSQLRSAKKVDAQLDERRRELGLPEHIKLLPESAADSDAATVAFYNNDARSQHGWKTKRKAILSQSIFQAPSSSAAAAPPPLPGAKRKAGVADRAASLAKRQRQ